MKRVISLVVLVISLILISGLTIYTLSNKGTRKEVPTKIIKEVSKVTSNVTKNAVADVYNVYLNDSRHKVKTEYNVVFEDKKAQINLVIYIDGKEIFNELVSSGVGAKDIDYLFLDENISRYVHLTEKDIKIIKDKKEEYMVINIGYYTDKALKKYYIFNEKGKNITDEDLIVLDTSKKYVTSDNEALEMLYDKMYLAKIDNNDIYVLKYVNENEEVKLEEYKYTLKNAKLNKELINTYSGIKLASDNKSKK